MILFMIYTNGKEIFVQMEKNAFFFATKLIFFEGLKRVLYGSTLQ